MGAPTIVHPPEELDPLTASDLERALDGCDPSGHTQVAFGSVRFCDSSGLRVLVLQSRRHADAGGRLEVIDVPPSVRRVFEITGTLEALGISPTSP